MHWARQGPETNALAGGTFFALSDSSTVWDGATLSIYRSSAPARHRRPAWMQSHLALHWQGAALRLGIDSIHNPHARTLLLQDTMTPTTGLRKGAAAAAAHAVMYNPFQ